MSPYEAFAIHALVVLLAGGGFLLVPSLWCRALWGRCRIRRVEREPPGPEETPEVSQGILQGARPDRPDDSVFKIAARTAILAVLLSTALTLLVPLAMVSRDLGPGGLLALVVFVGLLTPGFLVALAGGGLD